MAKTKSSANAVPQGELQIRVCTDIVRALLDAHTAGRNVNLNTLKTEIAKKHQAAVLPRLVDIIAAVPQEVRDILLPKLRAKPVRTASGVSPSEEESSREADGLLCADCYRGCHVQAASLPSHRHDWEHLRVSSRVCVLLAVAKMLSSLDVCRYCPGGPDSDFEYSTQSYTVRGFLEVLRVRKLISMSTGIRADVHASYSCTLRPLRAVERSGGATACFGTQRRQGEPVGVSDL